MNCTLFLEYYNYNDDKFDVKDFYSNENSYVEMLQKYATSDSGFMDFNKKEDDVQYTKCECKLYDSDNNDMTIEKIVGYYNTTEMIMVIAELDLKTEEDEFDSELNGWVCEHERLEKKSSKLTPDERFMLEPKRDIKMIFKNLRNNDTYCTLQNTSILEKIDNEHYVLLVDKIIFTKKF